MRIVCSSCNEHVYDTNEPITANDLGQPLNLNRFTPTKAEWKARESATTPLACPNCGAALLGSMPNIRQEQNT